MTIKPCASGRTTSPAITLPAELHAAGTDMGTCGVFLHLRMQHHAPELAE
jgi:hypothetical protein